MYDSGFPRVYLPRIPTPPHPTPKNTHLRDSHDLVLDGLGVRAPFADKVRYGYATALLYDTSITYTSWFY